MFSKTSFIAMPSGRWEEVHSVTNIGKDDSPNQYQDPMPEMTARYDFHSAVAGWIEITGLMIVGVGGLVGIIGWVMRRG